MRNKYNVLLFFVALVLVNLLVAGIYLLRGGHERLDARLTHEALGIAHLADTHYIFYTPGSHADLLAARPDLVQQADERRFAQGVQMPKSFRQMDHQRQFDALLLSGDPTTYKPLLKELSESKDFTLAWLDSEVLIFRRFGATPWKEDDLTGAAGQFTGQNRARFLAGAAKRLIAVGQVPMAKRALDAAAPYGARVPEYWTALASYDGEIVQWKAAMDALDKALALDPDFTPAQTTKAEILFGAGRFNDALDISDKVVADHPDDPSMLFLHAMISHQAHAYEREVAALNHLIEMAQSQGISTTGYEVYLGQAYAQSGDAMPSLVAFKKVVEADDASPEQKKFAQDCIDKIHDRTGAAPVAETGTNSGQ